MDTPASRAATPTGDRAGRVDVERVAAATAFLASNEAAHVTGAPVTT